MNRTGKLIPVHKVLCLLWWWPYEKATIQGKEVRVRTVRLNTFAQKGTVCTRCGLKAAYFAVECHSYSKKPDWHLNLYGLRNGKEVLMTRDHIIPRAHGGRNKFIGNSQPMCADCNQKKADKIPKKLDIPLCPHCKANTGQILSSSSQSKKYIYCMHCKQTWTFNPRGPFKTPAKTYDALAWIAQPYVKLISAQQRGHLGTAYAF